MSCNGCRVLRKGCSDACILRPCLQWIESPEAQGNATVFVAKFFGRAGLMGFINAVPEHQRPALFQSLLYEACGRTVNPVYGAVGLLWSGNWHVCQSAVETVLKGGTLRPAAASLLAGSKSMHTLPGRPQLSTHVSTPGRPQLSTHVSTLTVSPEIASRAQQEPEPSFSTARCTEPLKPNKRSLAELECDAADGGATAGRILQDRQQLIKRYRSSEEELKELRSNCTDSLHQQPIPVFRPQHESTAELPKLPELPQKPVVNTEPPKPSGQIFTPVARRVKSQVDQAKMHECSRGHASREELLTESCENIELDLTLNSHASAPSARVKLRCVRVSSPSTFSVTSENSVTSFDSAELSMARWPARTPSPRQERKLLDLLL